MSLNHNNYNCLSFSSTFNFTGSLVSAHFTRFRQHPHIAIGSWSVTRCSFGEYVMASRHTNVRNKHARQCREDSRFEEKMLTTQTSRYPIAYQHCMERKEVVAV
eukprot:scpid86461/ scgid6418/ 